MPTVVGCCSFPATRARCFDALQLVEVQQTFYQPPWRTTAERWRWQAPEGFAFSPKAGQLITHLYRFTDEDFRLLRERLDPTATSYGLFNNVSLWDDARRFAGLPSP